MKKLVIALVIIAIFTRIFMIDARPMDHDESIHAYLSYIFMKSFYYKYDPTYHGPFIYLVTGAIFKLFGDNEFNARMLVVFFSIIAIISATLFRKFIGNSAYIFSLILIFSPSILYYSRYFRNDIIVLASFITAIYLLFMYFDTKKERYAYLSSFFLSLMVVSKENGFIYLGILLSFLIFEKIYKILMKIKERERGDMKNYSRDLSLNPKVILISILIFTLIYSLFFSVFFSDLDGIKRGVVDSISHWIAMHEIRDHWKPIYYYAKIFLKYEFFVVGMTLFAVQEFIMRLKNKRMTKIEVFAFYWMFTSLIAYHVLNHKVPWLTVHMIAPMAFFSSIYASKIVFSEVKIRKIIFILIFLVNTIIAIHITYIDYNNTDHDLIYIQVQPSAVELAKKISNYNGTVLIYEPKNDYWPLPWYLRHESIAFSSKYYNGYDAIVTSKDGLNNIPKNYHLEGRYEIRPGHYLFFLISSLHQS